MAKEVSFEVGGIQFTAIRREFPRPHWVFRTDENGIVYEAGTGGISNESVPKMQQSIQELLDRVSKGDVCDFRKRMSLPEVDSKQIVVGAITARLVASEHGFDDYDVSGAGAVHRVCIPHGIKRGENFNVYCANSVKRGSSWQGSLKTSLLAAVAEAG